jgi:hypothetical protein
MPRQSPLHRRPRPHLSTLNARVLFACSSGDQNGPRWTTSRRPHSQLTYCFFVVSGGPPSSGVSGEVAEGEGFEPPDGCPSPVFKTGAFSRTRPPLRMTKRAYCAQTSINPPNN